jgi:hypothetical protein
MFLSRIPLQGSTTESFTLFFITPSQPVTQIVTQPVTQIVTQPVTQIVTQPVTQIVTQLPNPLCKWLLKLFGVRVTQHS